MTGKVPVVVAQRTAGESEATPHQGPRFLRRLGERRAGRVGLFAVVGGIGTVLNLLVMAFLLHVGAHYVLAALVAAELTILTNFAMQEKLVFAGDRRTASAVRTRFAQSVGFNNVEALLRMPILMLIVELLPVDSIVAQAGTLAAAFVVRYVFHSRVVYRARAFAPGSPGSTEGEAVATAPAAAEELAGGQSPGVAPAPIRGGHLVRAVIRPRAPGRIRPRAVPRPASGGGS